MLTKMRPINCSTEELSEKLHIDMMENDGSKVFTTLMLRGEATKWSHFNSHPRINKSRVRILNGNPGSF